MVYWKSKRSFNLSYLFFAIVICYLPAGRSVLGKTVPEVMTIRPEAAGRGPYSRPRAQFFPIRTDLGRQITCLLFSSIEYFVGSFCVEFSLQPFSNLLYACVWHLGNRKSTLRSFAFLCFLGHYLHFTFLSVKKKTAGKDAKAEKLVAVRTRGPDGKIRTAGVRAISQSDSRI